MTGTGDYGDSVYEGGDAVEDKEFLDPTETLTGDDPDEAVDTGYAPPEREPYNLRHFPTAAEEREGESLAAKLAEEEPDFEVDEVGMSGEGDEDVDDDELSDDPPDARSGRLVAPDEGSGGDFEKDEIATDAGTAGYAASAEEAAMHTVEDSD
jgi:hypothetical protein